MSHSGPIPTGKSLKTDFESDAQGERLSWLPWALLPIGGTASKQALVARGLGWAATTISFERAGEQASKSSMRSRKSKLSDMRRLAARNSTSGEVVALESKDDNEGFGFWLAEVVTPASYEYGNARGKKTRVVDGVSLVQGNWYIEVKIIDRYPATSSTVFKLEPSQKVWKVNAEGVMLRNVRLEELVSVNRRKTRSAAQPKSKHVRTFELSEEELQRCTEAADEKLDPAGSQGHDKPDTPDRVHRQLARNGSRSLRA